MTCPNLKVPRLASANSKRLSSVRSSFDLDLSITFEYSYVTSRNSSEGRFFLQTYSYYVSVQGRCPSNRFEFVELHACRDLRNVSSTDPALRGALAGEIRDACINVGFFYGTSILSMHGY